MQPSENLYDQKPEEPPIISVTTAASRAPLAGPSIASRFEYVENVQSTNGTSSGSVQVTGHVAPPKSSNFFADFGMDSGFSKEGSSNSSKVQVVDFPRSAFNQRSTLIYIHDIYS